MIETNIVSRELWSFDLDPILVDILPKTWMKIEETILSDLQVTRTGNESEYIWQSWRLSLC